PQEGQPPPTSFSALPDVVIAGKITNHTAGAYAAADLKAHAKTSLTAGLRLDYFDRIGRATVSPRLQVTQQVAPRWSVRGAIGAYTRQLEQGESLSTTLRPERATQYVGGVEYRVRDGLDASASLFYTDRQDLVVLDPLEAQTGNPAPYRNLGTGRSMGAELLARARFDRFFGWLSYTLARSDRRDGPLADRRLFDFDETHNLVALGSYRLGKWELGARFQYSTGQPQTPITGSTYLADANIYVPTYGEVNSTRIEAAHALDVRVDRTWTFRTWKLSTFLDITNVYAHARVLGYTYNFDYSQREAITDLPILPALGVRGTF
ncbi:MAG: TonB-dependent receptor, partial [Kofleriaceae bacterium]